MSVLEKVMGPPMAAPETPALRRLRFAVITLAALLGSGVLAAGAIDSALGPVITGALLAALLVSTLVTGRVYFAGKMRRDDAWLDHLILQGKGK